MYVKLLLTNLVPCLSPNADDLTLSGQGPANFGMPSVYLHIDVHLLIYVCRDGPVHIPLSWFWRKYCKCSSLYPGGCYSCLWIHSQQPLAPLTPPSQMGLVTWWSRSRGRLLWATLSQASPLSTWYANVGAHADPLKNLLCHPLGGSGPIQSLRALCASIHPLMIPCVITSGWRWCYHRIGRSLRMEVTLIVRSLWRDVTLWSTRP